MTKNLKMSTMVSICIAVVTLVCLGIMFAVSNSGTSGIMEESAVDHMYTALEAQTVILN